MKKPVTIQKKGALFFTVDAMIAAVVLSFTAILLISFYTQEPITQDTFDVLNNYVDYITDTQMNTYSTQYRYIYSGQNDSDQNLFVYQKIAKLYLEGNTELATSFANNITENVIGLVPPQFGFEYYIDENPVYRRNVGSSEYVVTNISHRILTYFTLNNNTVIGPHITRITIWS